MGIVLTFWGVASYPQAQGRGGWTRSCAHKKMLKSTRKEDPVPYPTRPPFKFLVNHEKSVLHEANTE